MAETSQEEASVSTAAVLIWMVAGWGGVIEKGGPPPEPAGSWPRKEVRNTQDKMPGLYRWAVNYHKSQRLFVPGYTLSIDVSCEQSMHYNNLENKPHFTDDPRVKGMAQGCTAEAWRSWDSKERCLLSKPRAANPPLHLGRGFLWRVAHLQQEWTHAE